MTVAILSENDQPSFQLNDADLKIEWFSGTGKGGQFRNKHQNSVKIFHIPTGIVKTAQTRERSNSLNQAKTALIQELTSRHYDIIHNKTNIIRHHQVGSGMRGDKVRTFRFQDDIATDHRNNRTVSAKKIMRGYFDLFW